ncbi:DUF1178 family protein [Sulfitobacter sp. S190]|uniref:DUF1178 family protein n=1 Tax=Sulfitobacter sp. S190 TaxID=2867022 RepID=UPI0021A52240|nr:DUF1178 family protein [Sulfitobacter sp. S190]UWR23435.1 DUF1178 family protein [Sulfitobacter sp. S190]
MIKYALTCAQGHAFESWFQSAAAFDALGAAGHLACAVCGDATVKKALMAPRVAPKTAAVAVPDAPAEAEQSSGQSSPPPDAETQIAQLRQHVEQNATYVGGSFAQRARDMHDGTAPEQAIYGEANAQEARKLIEDGVPVLPLPFKPKQKMQ